MPTFSQGTEYRTKRARHGAARLELRPARGIRVFADVSRGVRHGLQMTSGALAITRGPDTTKPRLGNWLPSQGWCSRDGGIRTRDPLNQDLEVLDKEGQPFRYAMFEVMLQMLHEVDKNATGSIKGSEQVTNPHTRDRYLFSSLVEESTTSSQLEGAATTREVAKEMIRSGRSPQDKSEQMIFNNFQAMQFIRRLGTEKLTPAIILELQRILTEDTLHEPEAAGRLRRSDEPIVIEDEEGKILHSPPRADELEARMQRMCDFANGADARPFIHPVVRAILLHFWLAYDHPFVDGNGRTARALWYWSMATQGYWLCEFISISRIIKRAPSRYVRAFLYSETDDNDVTYFVLNQLRVVTEAIADLHSYLARKAQALTETDLLLRSSRFVKATLNHRQLALVQHALEHPSYVYTIDSHRISHNVTYETARTDLLSLKQEKLLLHRKSGRRFLFIAPPDLRERVEKFASGQGKSGGTAGPS
jgi:Fic family protein